MKRILLYIGICIIFLAIVISLNQVYDSLNDEDSVSSNGHEESQIVHSPDEFSTHLPLILIETNNQTIDIDKEIFVNVSLIDNQDSRNYKTDVPTIQAAASIKYRGSSSHASFDKKQYKIEFKKEMDDDQNKAYSVFGLPEATDWVLNGPFLDRSLSRNYIGYKVSRELLPWAPRTVYCEMFIDNKYQGLYLLVEPVTNAEERLGLSNLSLISGKTAYVIRMDRVGKESNPIITYGTSHGKIRNETSISYPGPTKINELQYNYIIRDFSEFEKALYSDNFASPELGYAKYIDVDSFVDYYLINEFMIQKDAGSLSTFLYRDINSKLYVTTWDFNNSFDNIILSENTFERFYMAESNWFIRLTEDRNFVDKLVARYKELRLSTLSNEYLFNMIDENIYYLDDAIDRNFELWGYTFTERLLGNSRDPESFEEAVSMLKDAIAKRGEFLDNNIELLYDYCIN